MQVISRYCDTCGIKIHDGDFKRNLALQFEDKYYCKDCKDEVLDIIEHSKKKKEDRRKKKERAAREREEEGGEERKKKKKKDSGPEERIERKKRRRRREKDREKEIPGDLGKDRKKSREGSSKGSEKELATLVTSSKKSKTRTTMPVVDKDLSLPEPGKAISTKSLMAIGGALLGITLLCFLLLFSKGSPSAKIVKTGKKGTSGGAQKKWVQEVQQYAKEHPTNYLEILKRWEVLQRAVEDRDLKEEVNREYYRWSNQFYKIQLNSFEKYLEKRKYREALLVYFQYSDEFPLGSDKKQELFQRLKALERSLFQLGAEKIAPRLIAKARDLAEQNHYQQAIGTLMAFDKQAYSDSTWKDKIDEALQKYQTEVAQKSSSAQAEKEAEAKYTELMKEVDELVQNGSYGKAVKLLREFDPQYRKKYESQIRDKIREIAKKQNEEFEKKLAEVEWEVLLGDNQSNLLNWTFGFAKTGFSISGGVMKVDNTGTRPILRATGQVNWKDYLVEYEVRPIKGQTIFMVRYNQQNRGGRMDIRYTFLRAAGAPSGWHKVQWLIQGQSYVFRIWDGGSWGEWKRTAPIEQRPAPSGAIGFLATKGSSFEVRKMRVKVLSKQRNF